MVILKIIDQVQYSVKFILFHFILFVTYNLNHIEQDITLFHIKLFHLKLLKQEL